MLPGARPARVSGDRGERRRLQGGKAALAEIPKCTVGVKSLAALVSGADFWPRWQTVILQVILTVLIGIWLACFKAHKDEQWVDRALRMPRSSRSGWVTDWDWSERIRGAALLAALGNGVGRAYN